MTITKDQIKPRWIAMLNKIEYGCKARPQAYNYVIYFALMATMKKTENMQLYFDAKINSAFTPINADNWSKIRSNGDHQFYRRNNALDWARRTIRNAINNKTAHALLVDVSPERLLEMVALIDKFPK